jgi:hypothetical protein
MKCHGWKYRDTDEFMHESYPSPQCSEILTAVAAAVVLENVNTALILKLSIIKEVGGG